MDCKQIREFLWLTEDGLLSPQQQAAAEEHLRDCPTCRKAVAQWTTAREALRAYPPVEPTPDFTARVLMAARDARARRRWPRLDWSALAPAFARAVPVGAGLWRAGTFWVLAACLATVLAVPPFRELAGFHFGVFSPPMNELRTEDRMPGWEAPGNLSLALWLNWPQVSADQLKALAWDTQDPQLWQAAAEATSGEEAVRLYNRAIALAPREAQLYAGKAIRYTSFLSYSRPEELDLGEAKVLPATGWGHHFTEALATLQKGSELEPDNAFYDYLRAYFLFGDGRDEEAWAALHAGTLKPCYDDHRAEACAALFTAYRRAGWPELESQFAASAGLLFPHLAALRTLGRVAAFQGYRAERKGDHATALSRYEDAIRLGTHVRDEGRTAIEMSVGIAIQSIGWGDRYSPTEPEAGELARFSGLVRTQREAELKRQAFQTYAAAHGRPDLARWVAEEDRRSQAYREQTRKQTAGTRLWHPRTDPLLARAFRGGMIGLFGAASLAGLGLLWLLAALPWSHRREGRIPAEPWRWPQLVALWLVSLALPLALLLGLAGPLTEMEMAFNSLGDSSSAEKFSRWILTALVGLFLLLFESSVALRTLPRYREPVPNQRRAFHWRGPALTGAFRAVAPPTGALLAVLYVATLAGLVSVRHRAAVELEQVIQHEAEMIREAAKGEPSWKH